MAALAAQRRTDEELQRLKECTENLMTSRQDTVAFHRCKRQFHDLVAVASQNLVLAAILPASSWMSAAMGWELDERVRKRGAADKRLIFDAIESRDAWLASQPMSRMIMGYEEIDRANPSKLKAPIIWADVDELLEEHPGQVEDEWSCE
jgi:DNA-binding FadR family transcriptional regulator